MFCQNYSISHIGEGEPVDPHFWLDPLFARSMGGDLRLSEEYQGGAGFVLTLPATQSDGD